MGAADGILTAMAIFALLYVFYAGGYLGAGDIKFLMAIGVYTGHDVMWKSVIPVTLISFAVMVVMAVRNRRLKGLKIPMALPVSMGIILSL